MTREELFKWVLQQYGTVPEYPWKDENGVLRRMDNRKWYGVILTVSGNKIGLETNHPVELLNVKGDPFLIGSLRMQEGYFPAYHMNKEKWISILLGKPELDEEIRNLLDMSYRLTEPKKTIKKRLAAGGSVKIRKITDADNSVMAEIIRENLKAYHLDIPGTAYFDPELDHLSVYYQEKPEKRAYFIAEDDRGQVIGGVGIAEFSAMEDCGEVQKLYLTDDVKGKGIGKKLLLYVEEQAGKMGYKRLYLETHTNLQEAIWLYERMGFLKMERPEFVFHSAMDCFYKKELF